MLQAEHQALGAGQQRRQPLQQGLHGNDHDPALELRQALERGLVDAIGGEPEARAWLAGPFNTTAMLLLVVTLFWHTQLGLRVIVEDYVHHEPTRLVSLLLVNFATIALGSLCVVEVLKVSLGS